MTLDELKNIMPNCVNCRRHCPMDDLRCEKGRKMAERILAGEATPEEYINKAEERFCRRSEGLPFSGFDDSPCQDPENLPFIDRKGRDSKGFEHLPFNGPADRSSHGPKNMPFRGPGFYSGQEPGLHGRPRYPRLPQDDSLNSLLTYAAHKVRPRRAKGAPGTEGMAQQRILKLLGETSGISQQTLMEILAIRPGSLSELLKKLESKGLILRTPDENDRRKNTLSLTDAGRQALKETEERGDPFRMLSEEEQGTLKTLLKKIIEGND